MVRSLILLTLSLSSLCRAEDFFEVPPGPSNNLDTFRQQLFNHHLNKAFKLLKQNEASVRSAEISIISFGKDIERAIQGKNKPEAVDPFTLPKAPAISPTPLYVRPKPTLRVSTGMAFTRYTIFQEFEYSPACLRNELHILNQQYKALLRYYNFSTYYLRNMRSYDIIIGTGYSVLW